MTGSSTKYVLQSKPDKQFFNVTKKVIDASVLLKNICDLTEVRKSIDLDCSAWSLDIFIKLINQADDHDAEYEENLFKNLTEEKLIELIKEIAILDSDFFLDSIADFILRQIKEMKWNKVKEYLYLEDDFTPAERDLIEKYSIEYFLSINTEFSALKFPFPNTNFSSLETKFSSPMNALLARIVQRSKDITAYNLSMINKAIKNENDRYPLKLTSFQGPAGLRLLAGYKAFVPKQEYFNVIKNRKVIALRFLLQYKLQRFPTSINPIVSIPNQIEILSTSLEYCIPQNNYTVEIWFQGHNDLSKLIYYFDITTCPFKSLRIILSCMILDFKSFYDHVIVKGVSKRIEVSSDVFEFFQYGSLELIKKSNSIKFHECIVDHWVNPKPKFIEFLKNYMDSQGKVIISKMIRGIPKDLCTKEAKDKFIYDIPTIQNYLSKILSK